MWLLKKLGLSRNHLGNDVAQAESRSQAITVDSISCVLFLFEKIKSPACPILFKFSGEPCYGFIYSLLYEWDL